MGMAASQARFLSLTARKSNTEYQGQQINQERTALANESSNIFAQLSKMEVPTPPNTADFYKTVYSFTATELSENGTRETYKLDEIVSTPDGDKAYVTYRQPYYSVANSAYASRGFNINLSGPLTEEEKASFGSDRASQYANLSVNINGTDYKVFARPANEISSTVKSLADENNGGNKSFLENYINDDGSVNDKNVYYFYDESNKAHYLDFDDVAAVMGGGHTFSVDSNDADKGYNTSIHFASLEDALLYNFPKTSDSDIAVYIGDSDIPNFYVNYANTSDNNAFGITTNPDAKKYNVNFSQLNHSASTLDKSGILYNPSNSTEVTSNTALFVGENYATQQAELDIISYEENDIGRLTSVTIKIGEKDDGTPITKKYELDCTKEEDEAAYKQAMLDYEYEYAKYQKEVSDLNNKTEEIQQKDKTLELELKQLDTEQNAIKTEMDAVQKVIEDNTESTFKTFG